MDMEGALLARLMADAAVAALVGTRVYWEDRPQEDALPAITLQVIPSKRVQHMTGFQRLQLTRVQMDVWAESYESKKAVAEAAIAAVTPRATVGGVRFDRAIIDRDGDLPARAGETSIRRRSIDLGIWHSPA